MRSFLDKIDLYSTSDEPNPNRRYDAIQHADRRIPPKEQGTTTVSSKAQPQKLHSIARLPCHLVIPNPRISGSSSPSASQYGMMVIGRASKTGKTEECVAMSSISMFINISTRVRRSFRPHYSVRGDGGRDNTKREQHPRAKL